MAKHDTRADIGYFIKNSRIDYDTRILYGDSLYFDRSKSFASATNNIRVLDTANKSIIRGHYAEVYRAKDSLFITNRAVAVTLKDNDSIYVHADTLQITGRSENRILKGFYRARFFKQGTLKDDATSGNCDSIFVNQKIGLTKLIRNPVLWTGENQIIGDTIHILSDPSTEKLDTLKVFNNAFLIQKDSSGYNQVKGHYLTGLFTNNELDTVNINKNTEVVYYSRNEKKELTGINNTVSSAIQLHLIDQKISGIRFIKQGKGKVYPPSKFPENFKELPGFNWRGEERITNKEDLFKGKPIPILPKIKGLPLPSEENSFFDNIPDDELNIPAASKLSPKHFKNKPEESKPLNNSSENKDHYTSFGHGGSICKGQLYIRYGRRKTPRLCGWCIGMSTWTLPS